MPRARVPDPGHYIQLRTVTLLPVQFKRGVEKFNSSMARKKQNDRNPFNLNTLFVKKVAMTLWKRVLNRESKR